MTPSERGRIIWRIGDLISEHLEEFAELETLDNGKPLAIARAADVPLALAIAGLGILIVVAPSSVPGLLPPM